MLPQNFSIENTNSSTSSNKTDEAFSSLKNNSLLSRDAFLKLFIEQLKNQDPLNPMENYEISGQLAQFSSLEQLYDINKNFSKFIDLNNKMTYFQGISLLGKSVEFVGDKIAKTSKDKPVEIKFNLKDDASKVNINIFDDKDNFVKSIELHDLTKGENSATWDGKNVDGQFVDPGIYRYEIVAYSPKGDQVDYTPYGNGTITNLRYDKNQNEAFFKVDGEEITFDKILSISN